MGGWDGDRVRERSLSFEYPACVLEQGRRVLRTLLIERGVDPKRLQVVGYGEVKPRQPNDTEAGRAANRRIEIKLLRQRNRS